MSERDTWLARMYDHFKGDERGVTAAPPRPQTDAEEWDEWRGFIGSKRTCAICGAVIGDPVRHGEWHQRLT